KKSVPSIGYFYMINKKDVTKMGINKFTTEEIEELKQNPYVKRVSSSSITYTKEFKELFVLKHSEGQLPHQIFSDAGFDITVLKQRRINTASHRWREKAKQGESLEDLRLGNSGRPRHKELTEKEELKRLKAEVAYLKAENDFLKKLEQAEREAIWKANSRSTKNSKS
ncbi:HTH domain-containing protein, partial [Vagococcus fluvialis]